MEGVPPTWKTWRSPQELSLSLGGSLPEVTVAYETWGNLSPSRDNIVVVLHALSGSSHVTRGPDDPVPGWWEDLVVAGAPLGTDRHFVICPNLLGGCYGSTGPSSVSPRTGERYALDFPPLTIADLVEVVRLLLRGLDLDPQVVGPLTLVGGSMGGMLVLEWAALYPEEVRWGIGLGTPGRSFAQTIALRSVQRRAIMNDPDWRGGRYDPDRPPADGLSLARQIGMITYRSDREFWERFHRDERDSRPHFTDGRFEIQSYLEYQGQKFVKRFDANTYLYFSRAMDLYDLGASSASYEEGVLRIRSPIDLISFSDDIICPAYQSEEVYRILAGAGRPVQFQVIDTIHGHDAFLIETVRINELLAAGPPGGGEP